MDPLNPKDLAGQAKPDLSLVTRAMMEAVAAALKNGATKYGRNNWRSIPINALVYTAAAMRHIKAWEDGEDFAADSGVHHLDHAIASLAIMRDAAAFGTLVDNRSLGAPAQPAPREPRYGVFYVFDGGLRSSYVTGDYPSRAAAIQAIKDHPMASDLGVSAYEIKELP